MQMNLEFKGTAKIIHINVRKEKSSGDNEVLAIDAKVRGEAPADVLWHLLGCSKAKAAGFWDQGTEEKRGSFNGISAIACWTEFEGCKVKIGEKSFEGVKARKFIVKPDNYETLKLTCQLSIADIHDQDVAYICELMNESVLISVKGEPGLFDDNEDTQDAGEE